MDLTQLAIQASLSRNWKEAVKLNLQILKSTPTDTDALNRLAKAYLNSGLKTKSESLYKKVLRLDKYNPIAHKGLENLKNYKVERKSSAPTSPNFASAFLEEPGTTKTVALIRLGDPKVLSQLQPGDEVKLVAREHCVLIVSSNSDHLGRLPDDLASRLRPLMKAGNKYQAWVKSVNYQDKNQAKHVLKVFVKETYRVPKYRHLPSFPPTEKLSYAAFTPPELVHTDRPQTTTPEEDTEEYSSSEDPPEPDTDAPPRSDDD